MIYYSNNHVLIKKQKIVETRQKFIFYMQSTWREAFHDWFGYFSVIKGLARSCYSVIFSLSQVAYCPRWLFKPQSSWWQSRQEGGGNVGRPHLSFKRKLPGNSLKYHGRGHAQLQRGWKMQLSGHVAISSNIEHMLGGGRSH